MEMAASTLRLDSESDEEEPILADSATLSSSWFSRSNRVVVAAFAGIAVLGVAAFQHGRHTQGRPSRSGHLGSRLTFDALGSNLDSFQAQPQTAQANSTSPLLPVENLHDGNPCAHDEELWAGMCYSKCSILAPGFPKRTSAWTCCHEPCNYFSGFRHDFGICSGFSVAGASTGQQCPHRPGACLANEEMQLGRCYKKCSILTNGDHPNRVGPATCCNREGLSCLNPLNLKTTRGFLSGGGGDDDDPATPAHSHGPLTMLTEAR